jgi:cyclic beta-1,2-glucan synthetase
MSSGVVESGHDTGMSFAVGSQKLLSDAASLGRSTRITKHLRYDSKLFYDRFGRTLDDIREGHRIAIAWAASDLGRSPIVDWVLDNYYSIQERVDEIQLDLPKGFFSELPKVAEGQPRIQLLATELLLRVDSALDNDVIVGFANAFQESSPLTIGECWAYSTSLKIGLMERLSEICRQLKEDYFGYLQAKSTLDQLESGDSLSLQEVHRITNRFALMTLDEGISGKEIYTNANAVLDSRFLTLGITRDQLRKAERHRMAATQVSIGNVITSLRFLSGIEWLQVFEAINATHWKLNEDGVYRQMEVASQNQYRSEVERLSKGSQVAESDIAQIALNLGRETASNEITSHVGYWLVDSGRIQLEKRIAYRPTWRVWLVKAMRRHPAANYFSAVGILIAIVLGGMLWMISSPTVPWLARLLFCMTAVIPISEWVLQIVHWLVTKTLPVAHLPKMNYRIEIPDRHPTLVVMPTMLTGITELQDLLSKLENHFLTNGGKNVFFALLTDFADSASEHEDIDCHLLDRACLGIQNLNQKYPSAGNPFYLFHRHRQWNDCQGKWMGWERKRGKLLELGEFLLHEKTTSYSTQVGDLDRLTVFREPRNTPYIITLDSDTRLPRHSAGRLVGVASHPLNRPAFAADGQTISRGYSIFQPRVSIHLAGEHRSRYFAAHAGRAGVDPYTTAASDVYQDLFGEGSFTGKGLYDLRTFERMLQDRFPENRILSHDLIEGCFARVALVSDIEVFDGYPSRYDADAKRLHRWTRGDWQIASWLFPRIPTTKGTTTSTLSLLSRWKIFDNLRRSLYAPSLVLFLLLGWLMGRPATLVVSIATLMGMAIPLALHCLGFLFSWQPDRNKIVPLRIWIRDLLRIAELVVYQLAFLPHRALQMVHAISVTLYRLFVSQRNLLEWETAAAVEKQVHNKKWLVAQQLSVGTALAIAVLMLVPDSFQFSIWPIASLWLIAPGLGHLVSQTRKQSSTLTDTTERSFVMQIASGTWAYFETFVTANSNWLPPDNVQEFPRERIAYRISPTNEGMYLVSCLCAQRLGFLTIRSTIQMLESNLDTWLSLPTQNGHHYNWYDTLSLKPLHPRYLSTVDSGNLLAAYLSTANGLHELHHQPLVDKQHVIACRATLDWVLDSSKRAINHKQSTVLSGAVRKRIDELAEWAATRIASLQQIESSSPWVRPFFDALKEIDQSLAKFSGSLPDSQFDFLHGLERTLSVARQRIHELIQEISVPALWIERAMSLSEAVPHAWQRNLADFANDPTLERLAKLSIPADCEVNFDISDSDRDSLNSAAEFALEAVNRIQKLQERCRNAAEATDFSVLFVQNRELFSIGLNLETGKLDRGFYDLLSSECRLASFLAIARGQVDAEHWFRLGRQSAGDSLLSWGGTMFEYLMPNLFLRSVESSLLDQSARSAIQKQIEYGKKKGTPWGISESAFSSMSGNLDYQYKSFGVPGLGLKRGLSRDLVISPYSTILALMAEPKECIANLRRLVPMAMGTWGFYDAVDFTRSRLRTNEAYRTVQNYMAHHQGMSLLAMTNALLNNQVQRWFHTEPMVQANELLLEEKVPIRSSQVAPNEYELVEDTVVRPESTLLSRKIRGYAAATPKTHILSNGRLHVMLTHAGGGSCALDDQQVTRWQADATRDNWGPCLYIRNLETAAVWSATYQPTCVEPDHYETLFSVDKVEYRRVQGSIESTLEVVVSPEHNAEVRQLRLVNLGSTAATLQLTSYSEVSLTTQRADQSHPAFQKLFIETEYVRDDASILATRRPREKGQATLFAVHTIAAPTDAADSISFDSSRESFLGRCRDSSNPIALEMDTLKQSVGAVLDPVFALRCNVTLAAGESVTLGFTTSVAASREEAIFLADFYHDLRGVQRAFELAWAFAQSEETQSSIDSKQLHLFHQLAGYLAYANAPHRMRQSAWANRQPQSGLWKFGISGDIPILYLRVDSTDHMHSVMEALQAQRFLSAKGLEFDWVIVNDFPGTYFDAVDDQIRSLLENHAAIQRHTFLVRGPQLTSEDRVLLEACATVLFDASIGGMEHHLKAWDVTPRVTVASNAQTLQGKTRVSNAINGRQPSSNNRSSPLPEQGFGRFSDEGFRIQNNYDRPTPAPWSNILANESFGSLITNGGGGYSWFGNSRENKLTTWSNDPTSDPPSEVIYLKHRSSGHIWSPTYLGCGTAKSEVLHGHGFSKFVCQEALIDSEITLVVDKELAVKYSLVKLTNLGTDTAEVELTYYAETVLGVQRDATRNHQHSSFDSESNCIVMRNGYSNDFSNQEVFLKMLTPHPHFWTCNRQEFLGRYGSLRAPKGLELGLESQCGFGLDPCLALGSSVKLAPNESQTIVFLLGVGMDRDNRLQILKSCADLPSVQERIRETLHDWSELLESIVVKTPEEDFDRLINGWLLYQTVACRIYGRSAFYQSGGAFGFRDQLQDVMAVVYSRPGIARKQILRSAARQYVEGDVQHWWHPPSGKGTRTRFSDDFLFLPWVVSHYVRVTGDEAILQEPIPFVTSPHLTDAEHERYEQPAISTESATLLEHCWRSIQHGMKYGRHGLPLMGCGDWNDGMSRVGIGGQGESVWVAWFQIVVFEQYVQLLKRLKVQPEVQSQLTELVSILRQKLEENAWDGDWYSRAFFDDGQPLGSRQSEECQIDSLSQSWSVIANGETARTRQAFHNAVAKLYIRNQDLVLLFTPPFDQSESDPGYIQGYLPGIRENGGQYTHGALWMVQAAVQLQDGELAYELFRSINPITHTRDIRRTMKYKLEPYVVAADVYANPLHMGRGGWSWYTGSAAWMYRMGIEHILGMSRQGNRVTFHPCVPKDWDEFHLTLRVGNSTWKFHIKLVKTDNKSSSNEKELLTEDTVELYDDGTTHEIELRLLPRQRNA